MFANSTEQLLSPNEDEIEDWAVANNSALKSSTTTSTQLTTLMKAVHDRLDIMESNLRTAGRGAGGRGAGRGGRGDARTTGRATNPGRGSAGRGNASQERPTVYCFEHGFQRTHTGVNCHRMKNDTTYTQEMKNATGPCTINGYEGCK